LELDEVTLSSLLGDPNQSTYFRQVSPIIEVLDRGIAGFKISGCSLKNLMVDSTNVHWIRGFGHEVAALAMPTTMPRCPMLQCFRDFTTTGEVG